ncbi:MAG: DUF2461 domain-containing protein [Bryobacterales bacterium]|nr:DUF2461 domain-containing protein [Bryobacterales bacterium]
MKPAFSGFPPEAIRFLRDLKKHNDRDWFQPRKEQFETQVRAPMISLVAALQEALRAEGQDYGFDAKKSLHRIYRDTRFSADKTPYKSHISAALHPASGRRDECAGFYVAISGESVEIGGGIYHPPAPLLLTVRTHVAAHHERLRAILANRTLHKLMGELQGDRLTRVPKGFAADHPATDLLRYKDYFLYAKLPPGAATQPDLLKELWRRTRAMLPLLDFLNEPLIRAGHQG